MKNNFFEDDIIDYDEKMFTTTKIKTVPEEEKFATFQKLNYRKKENKLESDLDKFLNSKKDYVPTQESLMWRAKQVKEKIKFKLSSREKRCCLCFSFVVLLLSSLAIYNAISINNLNNEIVVLESEKRQAELEILQLDSNISSLNDDAELLQSAFENGYYVAETKTVSLYEKKEVDNYVVSTGFFNTICNFLKKLFN